MASRSPISASRSVSAPLLGLRAVRMSGTPRSPWSAPDRVKSWPSPRGRADQRRLTSSASSLAPMVDDRRVPAEVDKHVRSRPSDRVALDACSSQSCSQTSREMLCAGISREASASGRMAGFVYLGDPVYAQAVIRCGLRPPGHPPWEVLCSGSSG
jgi:hypothetical protein